ncbi:hypothetical protein [Plasmodium yoelii yoelii]|uniref:Uncharacterized protein n=1 Tax=Plasmodium yoelii yoelii TaxID=73239 RepID=Q7R742_PLAYO|nr:hypothetical protein [Plasmodium yoelii yoelii]
MADCGNCWNGCPGSRRIRCRELPAGLRRLLHRHLDFQSDTGHAPRQACGGSLRPTPRRHGMRHLRKTGTPGLLFRPSAFRRNVWRRPLTRDDLAGPTRTGHPAGGGEHAPPAALSSISADELPYPLEVPRPGSQA